MSTSKDTTSAKPKSNSFDKSKWREKKYSHKIKVKAFEEKRRKAALHKYYKELKKSEQKSMPVKGESGDKVFDGNDHQRRHSNPYEQAKQELERRRKEKEQIQAEKEKEKSEREEALQKYKKDKIRKYIKLKKKTKKGQPVMAGRMELLLEKIQKSVGT